MKRPLLLGSVLAWWMMPVMGGEIAGTLTGEKLTWQSAQMVGDGLVPAVWDIPLQTPAASRIIPGGQWSITATTVTLTGSRGSVTVPITLTGMAYQLASNGSVADVSSGTATSLITGTLATVKGQGVGGKVVTLSSTTNPYTHYRPIIKPIIANDWLAAFKAAGLPKGRYQGVVSYRAPNNYFRQGGPIIRYTLQGALAVKIDYNPAQLNAVTVTGENVITARYYGYPERLVGGETRYTITATGLFPNGVKVGLKNTLNSGNRYQLLPQTTTNSVTAIDYSVTCTLGCVGNKEVIKNGVPKIDTTTNRLTISETSPTLATAEMTVSFTGKPLSALSSDVYRGSFVLIFEAGV